MTACADVLGLPELQANTFCYLDDSDLANVARVSKSYFDTATDILWGRLDGGGPQALKAIGEQSRREIYAPKMRILNFNGDNDNHPTIHDLLREITFPRLKKLAVSRALRGWSDGCLARYLTPSLEHLEVYECSTKQTLLDNIITQRSLIDIAHKCPHLKDVKFTCKDNNISAEDLVLFYRSMPELLRVHLEMNPAIVTNSVINALSEVEQLEHVHLNGSLDPEAFASSSMFTTLRSAYLDLSGDQISSAASAIRNLTELTLIVNAADDDLDVFQPIANITGLRYLHMQFFQADRRDIPPTQLMALRSLSQLQTLIIEGEQYYDPYLVSDIDDDGWEGLVSGLRDLRYLFWPISTELTITALTSLAQHCPGLKELALFAMFDIEDLRSIQNPLFPNLTHLTLENEVNRQRRPKSMTIQETANIIRFHAPELKWFDVWRHWENEDQYTEQCVQTAKAWVEHFAPASERTKRLELGQTSRPIFMASGWFPSREIDLRLSQKTSCQN